MTSQLPVDFDSREHLPGRAIIPLHPQLLEKSASKSHARLLGTSLRAAAPKVEEDFELPDLDDVQGDIVYLFPKKAENFIFFRIADVTSFRDALAKFKPSTSKDTASFILELADRKRRAGPGVKIPLIPKANLQIAFSRIGLNVLGVKGATGDTRFDKRVMRDDKPTLGDQRDWDAVFEKKDFDPTNGSVDHDNYATALHGVITVAGSDEKTCTDASDDVKKHFGSSILVKKTMAGRARPGDQAGHEHFGYEDGVSQPALRHLTIARPGQVQVNPGVILLGYKGDPIVDDPDATVTRPAWAKGGTIMVFRKLEQSVPEFNNYLKKNGPKWRDFAPPGCPVLTNDEGAELWGARIVGRWKSGAPLAKCPFKDDPVLALDPNRNNDFDYRVRGVSGVSKKDLTDYYVPFTAHTRKTVPRDLDPFIQRPFLESAMIVRAGLPYGIEVTPEEAKTGVSSDDDDKKRGLLFICYQSSLDQGFVQQTLFFAGNRYFPTASLIPQYKGPDPIIGGPPPANTVGQVNEVKYTPKPGDPPPIEPKTGEQVNLLVDFNGDKVSIAGFAQVQPASAVDPPGVPQEFFVTSRGGEYFFVPPVSALKDWAAGKVGSGSALDLLLVMDATSSMQPYIDEVRKRLDDIIDQIVASGMYAQNDIRVGLIAFRDHPQPDRKGVQQQYEFVTQDFGFSKDIKSVKAQLETLVASGGGDGPEAQCDALNDAVNAAWRDDATKIAIMVTDSPPHGIGEYQDKIPDGCPLQYDGVRAANIMADNGITLHVIACEPTLSGSFATAHDYYTGITQITGGKMVALSNTGQLCDLISGHVAVSSDIRGLAVEHHADIAAQARGGANAASISQSLFKKLSAAGVQAHAFDVEEIYAPNADGSANANVWAQAKQTDAATKSQLRKVHGFRVKQEHRPGGAKYQQPLQAKLVKQPLSQAQADAVVDAALRLK